MKDYTLIYNLYLANVIDRHLKICEKEKIWRDVFGFFSPKNDFTEKLVGERDFAQFPHCGTVSGKLLTYAHIHL